MHFRHLAAFGFLAASSSELNANGFRLVSQDAYAAARGEAFAATADNPSAIHYNPAGISQLEGHQFRMGAYGLHFEPSFRAPAGKANAGKTYGIEKQDALAPQLYYTYGIPDSPLTLGLGVYAPHGAGVEWPEDTGFRTVAIDGELTYLRINPVASLEIRPGLSFAIGVMIDDASLSTGQGIWEDSISKVFKNSFEFEGDDLRCAYNLGLLWQINDQWSVGATYRSANKLNFEGRTLLEYEPFVGGVTKNPAEMTIEFPYTAVFGISYRPTKDWNIEFNADYSNWSCVDATTINQKNAPPFPVLQDIPVTLAWKDSWMLKFGVTRKFDEGWYASAGYVFNENSITSDYYSPIAADLDRHFFTLGIGRQWSRYNVDLAYQYGFAPSRIVSDSTPSSIPALAAGQNSDGKYDFESHGLLLSFGVKF
jgi:long-chain fatty acid transport protein